MDEPASVRARSFKQKVFIHSVENNLIKINFNKRKKAHRTNRKRHLARPNTTLPQCNYVAFHKTQFKCVHATRNAKIFSHPSLILNFVVVVVTVFACTNGATALIGSTPYTCISAVIVMHCTYAMELEVTEL